MNKTHCATCGRLPDKSAHIELGDGRICCSPGCFVELQAIDLAKRDHRAYRAKHDRLEHAIATLSLAAIWGFVLWLVGVQAAREWMGINF